ncbi:unnamed protein product [Meloidogyne enterolobii]|uniref:Uncharacterized protein n=1 Tax=Meloidogyne enterolobii TaxID=390850 RepID=A0ACB1AI11_MELEN
MRKAVELRRAQKQRDKAARKIQAIVRGFLARQHLKKCLHAAVVIQAHFRGFLVRKQFSEAK